MFRAIKEFFQNVAKLTFDDDQPDCFGEFNDNISWQRECGECFYLEECELRTKENMDD